MRATLVSDSARAAFLAEPRGPYPSDDQVRALLGAHRGWLGTPETTAWRAPLDVELRPPSDRFDALRALFALGATRGFDLALVMEPLPEVARTPRTLAALAALDRDLRGLAASYPRVSFPLALGRWYPDALCATATHLTEAGARRDSAEVADWIATTWNR